MSATSLRTLARADKFREAVALVLNAEPGLDVRPRPRIASLASAFSLDSSTADIDGFKKFAVSTFSGRDAVGRLGANLDHAVRTAATDGRPYGISITYRIGTPVGDQFAVLRLADFASIAAELEGIQR